MSKIKIGDMFLVMEGETYNIETLSNGNVVLTPTTDTNGDGSSVGRVRFYNGSSTQEIISTDKEYSMTTISEGVITLCPD